MKILKVTMPDGSEWGVPVSVIALDRAEHYKHEFGDDVARSLAEDTEVLFAAEPFEVEDWAANNMNWREVLPHAQMLSPGAIDYQNGWCNGEKVVFEGTMPGARLPERAGGGTVNDRFGGDALKMAAFIIAGTGTNLPLSAVANLITRPRVAPPVKVQTADDIQRIEAASLKRKRKALKARLALAGTATYVPTWLEQAEGGGSCPACGNKGIATIGNDSGCLKCKALWETLDPALCDPSETYMPFKDPCNNCAFRPGSPERDDPAEWKGLLGKLKEGGKFYCHKGIPLNEARTSFAYPELPNGQPDTTQLRFCRGYLNAYVAWRTKECKTVGALVVLDNQTSNSPENTLERPEHGNTPAVR